MLILKEKYLFMVFELAYIETVNLCVPVGGTSPIHQIVQRSINLIIFFRKTPKFLQTSFIICHVHFILILNAIQTIQKSRLFSIMYYYENFQEISH